MKPAQTAIAAVLLSAAASGQVVPLSAGPVNLTARIIKSAAIPAGTASLLIDLPADPSLLGSDTFNVTSSSPAAVIGLITPLGTEVTAANAESLGFNYFVIPDGLFSAFIPSILSAPGTHTVIQTVSPQPPGKFSVKVDGSKAAADFFVVASFFPNSGVKLGAVANGSVYRTGDTVVIAGLLFDGPTPVSGATVTAVVADVSTSDAPIQVTLADSGMLDVTPNDGVYTGSFTASTAGTFTIVLTAKGTSSGGQAFTRVAFTEIRVISPAASFTSFTDAASASTGSGTPDQVVSTAAVNVKTAGKYQYLVSLAVSNGQKLSASGAATLAAGSGSMSAAFSVSQILSLGDDGPFELRDAFLIYLDDPNVLPVDYRADAGPTSAYKLSSFNRGAIYFPGGTSAFGTDMDLSGKFGSLEIDAPVSVSAPGAYNWSGVLADSNGAELDAVSGSASFTAGSNLAVFKFSGTKLGAACAAGVFALRAVTVYSTNASILVDELFRTPSFATTLFPAGKCVSASPAAVSLAATIVPATTTVSLASTGDTFSFTAATSGEKWLTSRSSGSALPASLTIVADPSGLSPGTYTASVLVTAAGAANSPMTIPVTFVVTAPAALLVQPASLAFTILAGSTARAYGQLALSSNGPIFDFIISASAANGLRWLSASPIAGRTPASVNVMVNGSGLNPGSYTGSVSIQPVGGAFPPQTVAVTLSVVAPPSLVLGYQNAASFLTGAVSPGMFLTLYGSSIGPPDLAPLHLTSGSIDTNIGSTRVLFDGVPAPIVYAWEPQSSVIVPYEVAGKTRTLMQVEHGTLSNIVELQVVPTAPAIFSANLTGNGQGAILNQDSSANSAPNPAAKGSVIQIFATGEGQTIPAGVTGSITSGGATVPVASVTVTIAGASAEILYAGEAPALAAGVIQINAKIPADAPSGAVSVVVTIGGVSSQPGITVAVQ